MTVYISLSDDPSSYSYFPEENGGDPKCVIAGFGGDDILGASYGNDYLYGGADNDMLLGGAGVDHLYGEAGMDDLEGGAGADVINGGAWEDIVRYSESPGPVSINLQSQQYHGNDAEGDTLVSIEDIIGSQWADLLVGNVGPNFIYGNAGKDFIKGNGGDDYLEGAEGDDDLAGGRGQDDLVGGSGKDVFHFHTPADSLVGSHRDMIIGFRRVQHDTIDLRSIDANTVKAGNQAFVFIGADTFAHYHASHSGVIGMVRFAGGIVQGNVNANLAPDFEVAVHGNAPQEVDFLL